MARKDSEKDADRPHFYSQFWLDVAAGRRIIGTPRGDEAETDVEVEPIAYHRTSHSSSTATSDGYEERLVHPEVEPDEYDAEEFVEPDFEDIEPEPESDLED